MPKKEDLKRKMEEQISEEGNLPYTDVPLEDTRNGSSEAKTTIRQIEEFIGMITRAKLGFSVFSNYAHTFKLKDNAPWLFYPLMILAYLLDITMQLILMAAVTVASVGIIYAILRGIGAQEATGHAVTMLYGLFHH